MKKTMLFVVFCLFLTACGAAPAAPTATAVPPTLTLAPSNTPLPSETPTPAFTPTATPDPSIRVDEKGVTMRLVPAGEFTMGWNIDDAMAACKGLASASDCANGRQFFKTHGPAHQVTLDAFYMDVYEVTNAQYKACDTSGDCQSPKSVSSYTRTHYYDAPEFDNYPVVNITWTQAKTYCEWRSASLPTEAQWEKAAHGNTGNIFPWGNQFDGPMTNFCDKNCKDNWRFNDIDDGYADTAPVGSFESDKSPYGMYDMAGNVQEFVADYYKTSFSTSPSSNPVGPASGKDRATRGGSFYFGRSQLTVFERGYQNPESGWHIFGLRCASLAP